MEILTLIGHSEKVLYMRIFLTVLILILNLQSWTKAEDIKDLEIEGMSIGDSALDFFSKIEINNGKKDYGYKDETFYEVEIYNHDSFKQYENIQIALMKVLHCFMTAIFQQ